MKALYTGSFDPITYGHIDIINRASRYCDILIVAVANNPNKKYLLSLDERYELVKTFFSNRKKINVIKHEGLIIECCKQYDVDVIVRGIRGLTDMEYEFQMAYANKQLDETVETIFLMSDKEFTYLSSSMVRELAKHHADVTKYVPSIVNSKLLQKFSNRVIIGIAGLSGSGKSTLSKELQKIYGFRHINCDKFVKDLMNSNISIITLLNTHFGVITSPTEPITINFQELSRIAFSSLENLQLLNSIVHPVLEDALIKEILNSNDNIIIDGALLPLFKRLEQKLTHKIWTQNLVDANEYIRSIALRDNKSLTEIHQRLHLQFIILQDFDLRTQNWQIVDFDKLNEFITNFKL